MNLSPRYYLDLSEQDLAHIGFVKKHANYDQDPGKLNLRQYVDTEVPSFDFENGRINPWHYIMDEPCSLVRAGFNPYKVGPSLETEEGAIDYFGEVIHPGLTLAMNKYITQEASKYTPLYNSVEQAARDHLAKHTVDNLQELAAVMDDFNAKRTLPLKRRLGQFMGNISSFHQGLGRFEEHIKSGHRHLAHLEAHPEDKAVQQGLKDISVKLYQILGSLAKNAKDMKSLKQKKKTRA